MASADGAMWIKGLKVKWACALTRIGHLWDVHPLLVCHEPQYGENGKARDETGATVQQAQHKRIPEKSDIKQVKIGVHSLFYFDFFLTCKVPWKSTGYCLLLHFLFITMNSIHFFFITMNLLLIISHCSVNVMYQNYSTEYSINTDQTTLHVQKECMLLSLFYQWVYQRHSSAPSLLSSPFTLEFK